MADQINGGQDLWSAPAEMIMGAIARNIDGSRKEGTVVFYDSLDVEVSLGRADVRQEGSVLHGEAVVMIRCTRYGLTEIERAEAAGSRQELICFIIADILTTAVRAMIDGLRDRLVPRLRNSFDGSEHIYCCSERSHILRFGQETSQKIDLMQILGDDLCGFLGHEKYNWVRLETVMTEGRISSQVWVNGSPYVELSDVLNDRLRPLSQKGTVLRAVQYELFEQSESTYAEPKYTDEQLRVLCDKAIHIMGKIDSSAAKLRAEQEIRELCHDDDLAFELFSFIPEAFAEAAINMNVSNRVIIRGGSKRYEVYTSQLRTWKMIFLVTLGILGDERPGESFYRGILYSSARYYAFTQLADAGKDKNTRLKPLLCDAHEGYRICN